MSNQTQLRPFTLPTKKELRAYLADLYRTPSRRIVVLHAKTSEGETIAAGAVPQDLPNGDKWTVCTYDKEGQPVFSILHQLTRRGYLTDSDTEKVKGYITNAIQEL